jgi:hypothetical protein
MRKGKKILSGLSISGLILAGSLPLAARETATQTCDEMKQSKSVKKNPDASSKISQKKSSSKATVQKETPANAKSQQSK